MERIKNLNKIGALTIDEKATVTDGEHGSPDLDPSSGIYYLSGHNVKDNVLDLVNVRFCSKKLDEKNLRSRIKKNNVLLSIVGTVGNSTVIYEDFIGNTDRNVATIKDIDDSLNSYFISTFLNSNYGKFQTERFQTGNVQPLLNLTQVRKIKIPILSQSFQLQIEQLVKSAHQKQTQSKQLYREAEELLMKEIFGDESVGNGLKPFPTNAFHTKPFPTIKWFTITKKEIEQAHRYDSEYFQPKYAEIIKKIESYEGGWDLVKNAIKFKDKNFSPKEDQKYKYLALSNISSQGYIQDYQEEFGKDLPSRARRKINTNDLIISSIEGSLSSCALVEKEFDNSICSTGFFVLNSEKINSETLLILFKSLVIQELLQRGSKGTILTAISKTELESIKIPLIKPSIQKQIAEKIQESHKLRKESKELLAEAKRKVEEEIEK